MQQILFGATNPDSIKVDESASKIYWPTNGNGSSSIDLMSASLDGVGGESTLLSNLAAASSLVLNSAAGHLYVTFAGNTRTNPSRIDQYDLQDLLATPVTVVANNARNITSFNQNEIILNPVEMVFNAATEQLYWSEQGGGNILSSVRIFDASSNSIGMIAVADANPTVIAYANTEDLLVWISGVASSISSINAEDKTLHARYEHGSILSDVATMRTTTVTAIPGITTNNNMIVPEGSARLLPKKNLIATDSDTDSVDIIYTVTRIPLHGYLTLSGNLTSSFTQQDLEDDLVNYLHDGTETLTDQIELQLSDGINNSDRFKYDIQIAPVNDAPTLRVETEGLGARLKMPLQEGGVYVLDPAILIGFDAESAPGTLIYHLTSTVCAGSFTVDGVEATSFTGTQLATRQVQFEHDGSENAPWSLHIQLEEIVHPGLSLWIST